jgi:uncharacterized peroxidase-related enzyme
MPKIKVIQHEEAEGRLKEIYDDILEKRGKLAEVHKILSLNPETILTHIDLYMSIMFSQSPLSRSVREMIAVVVSAANNCAYCVAHHGAALNSYWKNNDRVDLLAKDYLQLHLTEKENLLCEYAQVATLSPGSFDVAILSDYGFTDREILDAGLVIAYFNFVNRIVLDLKIELESDRGEGYKYD